MITEKLITIIVPVYNAEEYIEKCISSILIQCYSKLEIICIYDTNSNDSTLEKLNSFKDERIKILTTNVLDVSTARNIGINNSSGEYILFLDADDWLDPRCVAALYTTMVSNNYDLTLCSSLLVDYKTKDIIFSDYYNHKLLLNNDYTVSQLLEKYLYSIDVLLGNKLFKKNIIIDNNIKFIENKFFSEIPFIFEYLFNCRNKIKFNFYNLHFCVINRNTSLLSDKSNYIDIFDIMEYVQLLSKKYNPPHLLFNSWILDRVSHVDIMRYKDMPTMEYCEKLASWIKEKNINSSHVLQNNKTANQIYKYYYKKLKFELAWHRFKHLPIIRLCFINPFLAIYYNFIKYPLKAIKQFLSCIRHSISLSIISYKVKRKK